MDVKTVCLGMLTDGRASGYDLKKEFESSFAHFFAAGYGSIYPALSALAAEGLVTCEQIPQDGKPDRKVYEITTAGRDFLLEALQNPAPCHKIRSEFLATMCFAHLMPPAILESVLDHRLEECRMMAETIGGFENEAGAEWSEGMRFVAGFGKAMMQAMTTYVEENRHLLTEQQSSEQAAAN